jgi:rRNA-processing protein FCF1
MHPNSVEAKIERYRTKGVVVDTNLLLLYFVGQYDRDQITRFKRTNAYTADEFVLLANILSCFSQIVTTPNILSEVSNLSKGLKPAYFEEFRKQVRVLEEKYIPSSRVCESNHFAQFGLTDSVIADLSKNQYLVLTTDLDLAVLLQGLGIDVINFNHLRRQLWMLGGE